MVRATVLASCVAALILVSGTAASEPEPWMRKSRPNELAYLLTVHRDCAVDTDDLEGVVQRAFHRKWIRRVDVVPGEAYLRIRVWCYKTVTLYPFTVTAHFAVIDDAPDADPRILGSGHEASGAMSYSGFRRAMESVVGRALDDHISANFDL